MPRIPRIQEDGPRPPRQRVQPVQARARRKFDAILDATAALLEQHGIDAVTILAIAGKAGLPPATVYHYFENRLAVFAALVQRTLDTVDTGLLPELAQRLEEAEPDFRALLQGLFHAYRQAPGYVPVLAALRAEPSLQALVRESNQRSARLIAGLLQQRTRLEAARAQRVAWIISECCELVLEQALVSPPDEAAALLDEQARIVGVLFRHYARGE